MMLSGMLTAQKQAIGNYQLTSLQEKPFYYYEGQKLFLDLNTEMISVSLEGQGAEAAFKSVAPTVSDQLSKVEQDYTRTAVNVVDQSAQRRRTIKSYYTEMTLSKQSPRSYYQKIEAIKLMPGVAAVAPTFFSESGKKLGMTNNFNVKIWNKEDLKTLYKQAAKFNMEVLGHHQFMPTWFTINVPKHTGYNAMEAANLFHETGKFEAAEPEFIMHDLLSTNDPKFPMQWSLENTGQSGGVSNIDMEVPDAWALSTGAGVRVAVIDNGIRKTHEDLAANIHPASYDAQSNTTPSQLRGSHGTPCAGIIAAVKDNNKGLAGIAPNAKLMAVSVSFPASSSILARGMNWAVSNGAHVISNSYGGGSPSGVMNSAINNALNNGRGGKGCVVVFSSGNSNKSNAEYPGNYTSRILCVGAIDRCGVRSGRIDIVPQSCDPWCSGCAPGSSYGNPLDVVAGGTTIPSTKWNGNANYLNAFGGTSAACPHVAGLAALILSINGEFTNVQVNDLIEQSARKIRTDLYSYVNKNSRPNGTWNSRLGYGLPNAETATLLAANFGCELNLTLSGTISNTRNYKAINNVQSTQSLTASSDVDYKAGNLVILKPGFLSATGSTFRAYNGSCNGSSTSQQLKTTDDPVTAVKTSISDEYDFIYNDEFQTAKLIQEGSGIQLTCYPNPFQYQTTIEYRLETETNISLQLFDLNGRWIQDLDSGLKAPGTYSLIFRTNNLNAGMYYTKLQGGRDVITTKLLITK